MKGHHPTAADELATLKRGLDRHRQRIAELDELSRSRALTKAESFELERAVMLCDGNPLPHGLTRGLARHGIKRDMSRYSKRPRQPGEEGEAESAGPERGVGGPDVRELQS